MSTPFYNVRSIEFRGNRMALKIDGKPFVFNLPEISKRLTAASKIEREKYAISPSGYGIHWSLIDEDLSIPGLLETASRVLQESEELNYADLI